MSGPALGNGANNSSEPGCRVPRTDRRDLRSREDRAGAVCREHRRARRRQLRTITASARPHLRPCRHDRRGRSDARDDHEPGRLALGRLWRADNLWVGVVLPAVRSQGCHPPCGRLVTVMRESTSRRVGVDADPDYAPRPGRPARAVAGGPGTGNELEALRADREAAPPRLGLDERAAEDDERIRLHHGPGGCWDVLGYAWSAVTSGAAWRRTGPLRRSARLGPRRRGDRGATAGTSISRAALLCGTGLRRARRRRLGARMFGRWQRELLRRQGFDASEEHGWDLRKVQLGDGDLADYFTKIAHEVTC